MSTQYTASWCFFHALCKYCARRGTFKSIFFKILVIFVSRINRQKEYCLTCAQILTSMYQSIVDNRVKIERTSNVVKMLEESALNYHIVLQWRINKIASWVSLKSSEVKDSSWIISAVLISPFCSSSCCQTSFPSIIRPMRNLWKLTLKIFFNSPEMNRFIFFSLYLLRMTKKMDYFLRNFVCRERESDSLVQYQSTFLRSSEWCSMNSWQVLFFVVLLVPLIGMQNPSSFSCNACSSSWSSGTSVSLLFESITNLFDPWEILSQEWVLSSLRDQNSYLDSMFIRQATGRDFQHGANFCVSLDPSSWLWWSIFSWKSVFTTGHCIKLFSSVFSHEILSNFNNTQKSCIHTKFTHFIWLWKPLSSFFILLQ